MICHMDLWTKTNTFSPSSFCWDTSSQQETKARQLLPSERWGPPSVCWMAESLGSENWSFPYSTSPEIGPGPADLQVGNLIATSLFFLFLEMKLHGMSSLLLKHYSTLKYYFSMEVHLFCSHQMYLLFRSFLFYLIHKLLSIYSMQSTHLFFQEFYSVSTKLFTEYLPCIGQFTIWEFN